MSASLRVPDSADGSSSRASYMFRLLLGESLSASARKAKLTMFTSRAEYSRIMHRSDEGNWDYTE
jgi:hypothetical protein